MTNEGMMCQMIQCIKAMTQGMEEDLAYAVPGSKKRSDGTTFWKNAAYNFSRMMGVAEDAFSADYMRQLYKKALR